MSNDEIIKEILEVMELNREVTRRTNDILNRAMNVIKNSSDDNAGENTELHAGDELLIITYPNPVSCAPFRGKGIYLCSDDYSYWVKINNYTMPQRIDKKDCVMYRTGRHVDIS